VVQFGAIPSQRHHEFFNWSNVAPASLIAPLQPTAIYSQTLLTIVCPRLLWQRLPQRIGHLLLVAVAFALRAARGFLPTPQLVEGATRVASSQTRVRWLRDAFGTILLPAGTLLTPAHGNVPMDSPRPPFRTTHYRNDFRRDAPPLGALDNHRVLLCE
jgi:hypothetical protein